MLMRGITPPSAQLTSQHPLPPASVLPQGPSAAPLEPLHFEEPEDTTGQARVRGTPLASPSVTPAAIPGLPPPPTSRTTEWRQWQKTVAEPVPMPPSAPPAAPSATKQRKVYSCRICGKPMTSARHIQFRGQRYCPDEPGQMSKEEWLMLKKIEAKAKAAVPPPSWRSEPPTIPHIKHYHQDRKKKKKTNKKNSYLSPAFLKATNSTKVSTLHIVCLLFFFFWGRGGGGGGGGGWVRQQHFEFEYLQWVGLAFMSLVGGGVWEVTMGWTISRCTALHWWGPRMLKQHKCCLQLYIYYDQQYITPLLHIFTH